MLSEVGSFQELTEEKSIEEDSNNYEEIEKSVDESMPPSKGKASTNKKKSTSVKPKTFQFQNPSTGKWCKYNRELGRIVSCKKSEGPYANVEKYKPKRGRA